MFGEAGQLSLTFPLDSVQDLVKKRSERTEGRPILYDKSILNEFPNVAR